MLTAELVRHLFDYNPETGILTRRITQSNNAKAGDVAGHPGNRGYLKLHINKRSYLAHRIAWLHYYGMLPEGQIDHRDRNPANNAIANLRAATPSQNTINAKRTNRSGMTGVYRMPPRWKNKPWRAQLTIRGKVTTLGYFATAEEAKSVRDAKARELHGEFFAA